MFNDDCVEVGREDYQNCFELNCVPQLYIILHITHYKTVLIQVTKAGQLFRFGFFWFRF